VSIKFEAVGTPQGGGELRFERYRTVHLQGKLYVGRAAKA